MPPKNKIPRLLHIQSTTLIEFPQDLEVILLGKPDTKRLPDIDLSDLPNSDFVSRTHLEIHVKGDVYILEDLGSANGTFLNSSRLTPFTPYQLNFGDRIDLGKNKQFTLEFRQGKNRQFEQNLTQKLNRLFETNTPNVEPTGVGSRKKTTRYKILPSLLFVLIFLMISSVLAGIIIRLVESPIDVAAFGEIQIPVETLPTHSSSSQDGQTSTPTPSPPDGQTSTPQTQPPDGQTTVRIEDLEFTSVEVTSLGKIINHTYVKEEAQGVWLLITIDVRNLGKSTTLLSDLSPTRFVLQDTKGHTYNVSVRGLAAYSQLKKNIPLGEIQILPQAKTRCYLVFDVSPGEYQLMIKSVPVKER